MEIEGADDSLYTGEQTHLNQIHGYGHVKPKTRYDTSVGHFFYSLRASLGKSKTFLIKIQNIALIWTLSRFAAERMVLCTAKERFMKGKFASLPETFSSDGSIINTIIEDG